MFDDWTCRRLIADYIARTFPTTVTPTVRRTEHSQTPTFRTSGFKSTPHKREKQTAFNSSIKCIVLCTNLVLASASKIQQLMQVTPASGGKSEAMVSASAVHARAFRLFPELQRFKQNRDLFPGAESPDSPAPTAWHVSTRLAFRAGTLECQS
jgi:hypothetical protein